MENSNICCFIPHTGGNDRINTIYYVYETTPQNMEKLRTNAFYRMAIVSDGIGHLQCAGRIYDLKKGDIFFNFASVPYGIESGKDFKYIYVSFIGTRANYLMDVLKINSGNCVFEGFESLIPLWESGFEVCSAFSSVISESIVLHTFSVIGTALSTQENEERESRSVISAVRKYIDENFSDSELSVDMIAREFSYNKKYLSCAFKQSVGIGISEYLMIIRIQHACALMNQGFSHVKEISAMCGYKDPLYFSKVFKKRMNITPSEFIEKKGNI